MEHVQWFGFFFPYQLLYHFFIAIEGTNMQWNLTKQNKKKEKALFFFKTMLFITALTIAGPGTGKW